MSNEETRSTTQIVNEVARSGTSSLHKVRERVHHYRKNAAPYLSIPDDHEFIASTVEAIIDKELTESLAIEEIRKLHQSYLHREAWIDLLSRGKNYVFVTIAFNQNYSDEQEVQAISFLIKAINSSLWGRRAGKDPSAGIRGYVAAEPHQVSRDYRGQLHFHMVLDRCEELEDIDKFRDVVLKEITRVKDKANARMLSASAVDVREVGNARTLAIYLTKCMTTRQWHNGNNLFFIEPNGLQGIVLPHSRNIMDY